ncbi:MAG TPA: IclR family transcriptional regulator [Anaerolineae bacterium]
MTTKVKPYPGTQAVLRAVSLLKMFDDSRQEWGLSELAEEVGLNKTTTYRLLTALESEGMVARKPNDTYTLGPEIVVLGGRALRNNDLRSVSKPELEAMAHATGETATLEVLSGHEVLIIDEVSGEYLMASTQSIGTRWPAFVTSTGKAMMAYLPPDELDAILSLPLPQVTPKTVADPEALRRELAEIREQGYAVADETLETGLVVVGAPVRNHDGKVIAAISLGGPSVRITPARLPEIGALVKETAARISAELGYRR